MKLTEKKCPNCGAGLSFDENAKSCKCEYCKREFEIERDGNDQINLIMESVGKNILQSMYVSRVMGIIIPIFAIIIFIGIIGIGVYSFGFDNNNPSSPSKSKESYLTDISNIQNNDYVFLDSKSTIAIESENPLIVDYSRKGAIKRHKIYLLTKNDGNILIPIYKGVYEGEGKSITVYTPVIYKNIKTSFSGSIASSLGTAELVEDYVYFTDDEYSVGYDSLDTLYEKVIKQYENEYQIKEQ